MRVGQRIQLTTDVHTLGHTHHAGEQGTIRKFGAGQPLQILMDDGRTQFPLPTEVQPISTARQDPMTGPDFAKAHGNDSSTWTDADFEAEINLAEIDAWRHLHPTQATAAAPAA